MSQIIQLVPSSGPGSGTVTSISAGTGITLTPNPITATGSVALTIPVVISSGGTNAITMANTDGVIIYDGTRLVTTVAGTTGQFLGGNTGLAPTFQNLPGAFTWSVITINQSALVNNGYICNKAGLLTILLPVTSAIGDIIEISGMNTDLGWSIAQNANQTIHFGILDTTTGIGGSLSSTKKYDSVKIVCNIANTDWIVLSSIGNLTVV